MKLDISFEESNAYMCPDFSENNKSMNVDFGDKLELSSVSVRIEDDVAYIDC